MKNIGEEKNELSFLDHLEVLRWHLIRSSFAIFISSICMYMVESKLQPEQFGSIPRAMWWSMATLTTVGYGDIEVTTTLGRFVASALMFLGLGLIATVTAIISAKFTRNYVDHHTNDDVLEKLEELEAEIEKLKELEEDELEKLDELDSEIQDIKDKFQ